jgi:lysophospholipase L1-like esterase
MAKHNRVVLAIGDSNGEPPHGWPVYLEEVVNADVFINNSQAGRCLCFDNPDERSNALANVVWYMDEAVTHAGEGVDDVVVMLGTNDCKCCFEGRVGEIEGHLRQLVGKIRKHDNGGKWSPRVVIVSPPPYGKDENLLAKYRGGAERAKALSEVYKRLADELHTRFADGHAALEPVWDRVSSDGVHMNVEGQKLLAQTIAAAMVTSG